MSRFLNPGSSLLGDQLRGWFKSLRRSAAPDNRGAILIEPRKIYILPTRFGLLYGVMLLAMLLGSNNYGSNPGFLLTFLLAGLGMAALFQTWKNLTGIEVTAPRTEAVYSGSEAVYPLRLQNKHNATRAGIGASIQSFRSRIQDFVDLEPNSHATLHVTKHASQRGYLPVGRVLLRSRFPLGLFHAWVYIEPQSDCLVYPQPSEIGDGISFSSDESESANIAETGDDDFAGHKPYQSGDSVMHVDWKALARGKGWWLKNFDAARGEEIWLRWDATKGDDVEQKLSLLTRAVLDLDLMDVKYGLELPTLEIPPDTGGSHRLRCLKALALYDDGRSASNASQETGGQDIAHAH